MQVGVYMHWKKKLLQYYSQLFSRFQLKKKKKKRKTLFERRTGNFYFIKPGNYLLLCEQRPQVVIHNGQILYIQFKNT